MRTASGPATLSLHHGLLLHAWLYRCRATRCRTMNASTPWIEMPVEHWNSIPGPEEQAAAIAALESGGVVYLPRLAFGLDSDERGILSRDWLDKKAKNISFDSRTETLSGTRGATADIAALNRIIGRFARNARGLIAALFLRTIWQSTSRARASDRWRQQTVRPLGERTIAGFTSMRSRRDLFGESASCGCSTTSTPTANHGCGV